MNWGILAGPLLGLVVLWGPSYSSAFSRKFAPCEAAGFCKCQFPDGRGLDLTSLRKQNVSWVQSKTVPDRSITVNLCGSPFKNESSICYGASVCLNVSDTEFINLGSMADSKLAWESLGRTPTVTFTKQINSSWTVTTSILLRCDDSQTTPKLEFISSARDKFGLRLTSSEACLKESVGWNGGGGARLGLGGVLLILSSILIILYFVVGYIVLRYIRGARGLEAIPNHTFWFTTLPNSVKRAVLFLVNGCKNPESYDRI